MTDTEANEPVKEIFDELFTLLESLETKNEALAELLKQQGVATDEKLKPFLDQAASGASVRWRAARARMQHLFTPIPVSVKEAKKETEARQRGQKFRQEKVQASRDSEEDREDQDEPETLEAEAEHKPKDQASEASTTKTVNTRPGETEAGKNESREQPNSSRTARAPAVEALRGAAVGPGAAKSAEGVKKSAAAKKG